MTPGLAATIPRAAKPPAYAQPPGAENNPLCIRNAPASAWMVQCIRSSGRQDTVANSGPLLRDRFAQSSKLFNKCCWKLKINKKRMETARRDA